MKMKKSNKMNASNNGYRPCEQGWQNETKKKTKNLYFIVFYENRKKTKTENREKNGKNRKQKEVRKNEKQKVKVKIFHFPSDIRMGKERKNKK